MDKPGRKKGSPKTARRMETADISVMIAGEAGDGVLFTGNVLAKVFKRHGWEALTVRDFPSNIRGEPTNYTVRARRDGIFGRPDRVDILLTFDCLLCRKLLPHLAPEGMILCDGEDVSGCAENLFCGQSFFPLHLRSMSRAHFGSELFKNMIVLGSLCYILGLETSVLEQIIRGVFLERKGQDVVDKNIRALNLGYEKAAGHIGRGRRRPIVREKDERRLILSGDEAVAFGVLAAGCRFFAAYPICPASEIWQWLARRFPAYNGVVVQTEDELAAINMAIGASYAGARAMTATSGPGASLMMEGLSLAGMAEIPLVIVHVQRVGPSTGMPTKSEQSDIVQWIFGSHGDFPRIVLAPGTPAECFDLTIEAFNLADRFQCPVILLTEEDMGQNLRTTPFFPLETAVIDRGKLLRDVPAESGGGFKRYAYTEDGVSPRVLPSMGNAVHMVEGNEHDERGYRSEEPEVRARMMEKRMRKLESASRETVPGKVWGEKSAGLGFICIGSVLGPVLEAMELLKNKGVEAKLLQMRTLWPFPAEEAAAFIESCEEVQVVESNYSGQLRTLIRSQVRSDRELRGILKYNAQTFQPADIVGRIMREAE